MLYRPEGLLPTARQSRILHEDGEELDALLRTRRFYAAEAEAGEVADLMLDFVGLKKWRRELATNLPYGEQRKLEIARALATNPKLILLDEPAAGMNPRETEELKALIRRIRDELGITVCLIEHDMRLVMTLSERVTVLNYGAKRRGFAAGNTQQCRSDGRLPRARRGGGRLRQALRGAMLELENIHTYYGHIHALKDVSLSVPEGQIVALIGGNGAGKTTTLRTVSGMLKPRSGHITLRGKDIAGLSPHRVMRMGLSHVPEGRRIFPQLSVRENLEVGGYTVGRKLMEERIQEAFIKRARAPSRRHHVGRRAANARDRPRFDGQPRRVAAGRAEHGPLAAFRRDHL